MKLLYSCHNPLRMRGGTVAAVQLLVRYCFDWLVFECFPFWADVDSQACCSGMLGRSHIQRQTRLRGCSELLGQLLTRMRAVS